MPVLFGNTYLLPAIIVVVLLVLLLAIMALRKRSTPAGGPKQVKKEKAKKNKALKPAEQVDVPTPVPAHEVPSEPTGAETTGAPDLTPMSVVTPSRHSPLSGNGSDPARLQHEVPIKGILDDIVHGWGDVTDDDLRRLSLFRVEKVQAAVAAFELPKGLKNDQHAHSRLSQLRRYAADLVKEAGADRSTDATTPAKDPALQTPAGDPAEETTEVKAPAEPISAAPPLSNFFGTVPVPPVPALIDEEPAEGRGAEEIEEPVDEPVEVEVPALVPETVAEPLPAFQTESAFIPDSGEARLEVQNVSGWREFDAEPASEWQTEETPVFVEGRPDDLEPNFHAVKSAEDLLALPAGERPDMVVHLEPVELCKVFEKTDDPELKKSIIDTLEHASNPASLEVLRVCLDDPDPQIQLYALDAADRLLGVE